jgi:hypothetical protein
VVGAGFRNSVFLVKFNEFGGLQILGVKSASKFRFYDLRILEHRPFVDAGWAYKIFPAFFTFGNYSDADNERSKSISNDHTHFQDSYHDLEQLQ